MGVATCRMAGCESIDPVVLTLIHGVILHLMRGMGNGGMATKGHEKPQSSFIQSMLLVPSSIFQCHFIPSLLFLEVTSINCGRRISGCECVMPSTSAYSVGFIEFRYQQCDFFHGKRVVHG